MRTTGMDPVLYAAAVLMAAGCGEHQKPNYDTLPGRTLNNEAITDLDGMGMRMLFLHLRHVILLRR